MNLLLSRAKRNMIAFRTFWNARLSFCYFIFSLIQIFPLFVFGCPASGSIILRSQHEVDSFAMNFPELDTIACNLLIKGKDVTDLSGLEFIRYVKRSLTISGTSCVNLRGLNNLTEVGRDFHVSENEYLVTGYFRYVDESYISVFRVCSSGTYAKEIESIKSGTQVNDRQRKSLEEEFSEAEQLFSIGKK